MSIFSTFCNMVFFFFFRFINFKYIFVNLYIIFISFVNFKKIFHICHFLCGVFQTKYRLQLTNISLKLINSAILQNVFQKSAILLTGPPKNSGFGLERGGPFVGSNVVGLDKIDFCAH